MYRKAKQEVLGQVQKCMMSLVGGSGHLASFDILPDTFEITKIEDIQDNLKKYTFKAKGYRESEFTVYDDSHTQEIENISGSIVLDKDLQLVRDEKGRIMIEPWNCSN